MYYLLSPQSGSHGAPPGENTHAIGEQRIVGGKEREQRQRWRRKMPTFNSIWFILGAFGGRFGGHFGHSAASWGRLRRIWGPKVTKEGDDEP